MSAWRTFKFIDLFAGIGGIRIPFEEQGGHCVFTSEYDKYAQKSYAQFFGEQPHGDITLIDENDIPDHDILLGGFPCQAFSIMGGMKGFEDTRGTLFFDVARILKTKRPYAFLLENVKQFKTHNQGQTFKVVVQVLESLGYFVHCRVLNALDYGLPQKRERIIIVGFQSNLQFDFPQAQHTTPSLNTILENEEHISDKYFASEKIVKKRMEKTQGKSIFYPSVWHENKSGNISILPYSCALRAGASFNYLLVNGRRRFTPRELLRLQGFPDSFEVVVSDQQIRRQTGNSVPVNMIRSVAKQMLKAIRANHLEQTYISPLSK